MLQLDIEYVNTGDENIAKKYMKIIEGMKDENNLAYAHMRLAYILRARQDEFDFVSNLYPVLEF